MDRETRISMVADYLIDKPLREIEYKYKVTKDRVYYWLRRHKDHFKMRRNRHSSLPKG